MVGLPGGGPPLSAAELILKSEIDQVHDLIHRIRDSLAARQVNHEYIYFSDRILLIDFTLQYRAAEDDAGRLAALQWLRSTTRDVVIRGIKICVQVELRILKKRKSRYRTTVGQNYYRTCVPHDAPTYFEVARDEASAVDVLEKIEGLINNTTSTQQLCDATEQYLQTLDRIATIGRRVHAATRETEAFLMARRAVGWQRGGALAGFCGLFIAIVTLVLLGLQIYFDGGPGSVRSGIGDLFRSETSSVPTERSPEARVSGETSGPPGAEQDGSGLEK